MESQQHLSRSCIVSALYARTMLPEINNGSLQDLITYIGGNFLPKNPNYDLVERVVFEVIKKQTILDEIIERAAPKFKLNQMYIPTLVILRMGIYELVFENTITSPRIIISEAVALAQLYGTAQDAKFVNGVLATVFEELKLDVQIRKVTPKDIDPNKIEHIHKVSAFVHSTDVTGIRYVALVRDLWGFWTLPKGNYKEGVEDKNISIVREIKSAIGITISLEKMLGESEYPSLHPEKGHRVKHISYFLANAKHGPLSLKQSEGLLEARWFPLAELDNLRMYENLTEICKNAIEILSK